MFEARGCAEHQSKKFREGFQLDPKLALQTNGDAKLAQIYNKCIKWAVPKQHKFSSKKLRMHLLVIVVLLLSIFRADEVAIPEQDALAITATLRFIALTSKRRVMT
jgi:hypothetical protein